MAFVVFDFVFAGSSVLARVAYTVVDVDFTVEAGVTGVGAIASVAVEAIDAFGTVQTW